jgi:hypothetical protein
MERPMRIAPIPYHVVTQSCLCSLEESIIDRFEKHNCLYQSPTIYRQGWEHYTVIAFNAVDIRELLSDLRSDRKIELLSKVSISETQIPHSMLAPANHLFEDLTDRQLAALQLALESGRVFSGDGDCTFSLSPCETASMDSHQRRNTRVVSIVLRIVSFE